MSTPAEREPAWDPGQDARTALGGVVLVVAIAVLALYAAVSTRSLLAGAAALHLLLGAAVWGFVLLTAQRGVRAQAEQLEDQRLAALAAEGRQALFEGRAPESRAGSLERARSAGHALMTLALSGASLGGAVYLGFRYPLEGVAPSLGFAAALGAVAFVLLLLGRYAFALGSDLLAAGARRALSGAAVALMACVALAAQHKGFAQADYAGYGVLAVEVLLGIEGLLLLLLEAYRPRRAGELPRPPFDSRLLGLLSAPSEVARSIARAVDYQFGFELSQTWVYQFVARWVAPGALFLVGSFWFLSVFVVVEPHQVVLVRRLGTLSPEPLSPGLHLKLPWPLSETTRIEATRLHEVSTGEHMGGDHEGALLWTSQKQLVDHHVHGGEEDDEHGDGDHDDHEDPLVVIPRAAAQAGQTPVNLVSAAADVHYRIQDPARYAERSRDARRLLRALAERELTFLFGGEDLDQLLRTRVQHQATLKARIQAAADRLGLGVTIESALLTDLHPPLQVGAAFEEPTAARERARAEVLRARRRETELRERTEAEVAWIKAQGALDAAQRLALARADGARFSALRALHGASPTVFRTARLLEALAKGSKGKRKVVVGKERTLTELDLQEKVSAEELGLGQEMQDEQTKRDQEGDK